MTHKTSAGSSKIIEWGFDLTDVKSDSAFKTLLKKYGFVQVKTAPVSEGFKGRFTQGTTTFANPAGIRMTVEHLGGKGSDAGALGYIGFTAPKNAESELMRFLKDFRGGKKVVGTDVMTKGGITRYVKQEDAYESGYIGEND